MPEPLHIKPRHSASSQEKPCLESRPRLASDPRRLAFWGTSSDPASCAAGFLQRTNSLEEKSRLVSAFKERQSSKNLLSCENSDRDGRFRRTETDFSNLFARGSPHPQPHPQPWCCPIGSLLERLYFFLKFYFFLAILPLLCLTHFKTVFPTFEYEILPPSSLLSRSPSSKSWMRQL